MKPVDLPRYLAPLALMILPATCFAAGGDSPDTAGLTAEAQASVAAFADALKAELSAAMQAGGPLRAVEICHTKAPVIARDTSRRRGMRLARVSLRNRSPQNAANRWQAEVLEDFNARLEAGEDPAALTWSSIADTGAGSEFRYMKAIFTQPMCLACHGENIDPAVADKIDALYPDDRATGFRTGDLRGGFVVTKSLD